MDREMISMRLPGLKVMNEKRKKAERTRVGEKEVYAQS